MSKLTLSFKGKTLKVFPVSKGSMIIGSNPNCNLPIDSLAVEEKHAQIDSVDTDSIIRDLGTDEGTFVNNTKIEGVHPLKDGDVIRIGKHTIVYTFENDVALEEEVPVNIEPEVAEPVQIQSHDNRQGWIQIMSGQNLGKTMSLNRSMTNLGKAGVSTAVITRRNAGYFISHLEGQHAIVKNEPIGDKSIELSDGDMIQIGNIKMQFYLE